MAALPYLHPVLYYIFLFTLHRKTLNRRYKFVAQSVFRALNINHRKEVI